MGPQHYYKAKNVESRWVSSSIPASHTALHMNLFDRFTRVAKSNLNNILQNLEDPEKIMTQVQIVVTGQRRIRECFDIGGCFSFLTIFWLCNSLRILIILIPSGPGRHAGEFSVQIMFRPGPACAFHTWDCE